MERLHERFSCEERIIFGADDNVRGRRGEGWVAGGGWRVVVVARALSAAPARSESPSGQMET